MSGTIKKKGRRSMQGYKAREYFITREGVMKYGAPGQQNKWKKKIVLSDISNIEPHVGDPPHTFTITKRDGRIIYLQALNDEEKWKLIMAMRNAVRAATSPDLVNSEPPPSFNQRQIFLPLLKLAKLTVSGKWRWRFFYIDDTTLYYYADPALGEELGQFPLSKITDCQILRNKHGKDILLQVDVKDPEKRSYFYTYPDETVLKKLHDTLSPQKSKGFLGLFQRK